MPEGVLHIHYHIVGFCSCSIGKCSLLALSNFACHSFNFQLISHVKAESCLGPWTLTFSSERYLIMSTMKAKFHNHMLPLNQVILSSL